MLGLKVIVGACWPVGYASFQFKLHDSTWRITSGGEWVAGLVAVFHSATIDGHRVVKLAWDVAWSLACKTSPIEKSSEFKSGEYGIQHARVQNSANNCWVVLAVWIGAKSTDRCIFYQDTSSGPRRPHAVSKALGSCHCWHCRQQSLNPQDLSLILLCRFFSPLRHIVGSSLLLQRFFTLKTMF
jgi:hypothetical protein